MMLQLFMIWMCVILWSNSINRNKMIILMKWVDSQSTSIDQHNFLCDLMI